MEAIAISALLALACLFSYKLGKAVGYARALWGPEAWLRLNEAHCRSYEQGRIVGRAEASSCACGLCEATSLRGME